MILERCVYNENTVHKIIDHTWVVWYPLDSVIEDLECTNETLREHEFELLNININGKDEFDGSMLNDNDLAYVKTALGDLRKRLDPNRPPRIPEFGLILEDDAHDW